MSESVGFILRQARQARSLTLEQVAQATHIRQRYLQALEENDFGVMPSHVQVRGFLRSYSEFLDLNAVDLLSSLSQTESSASLPPTASTTPPPEKSVTPAQAIYVDIGLTLRERRELLSLTLDEVEQHTHISSSYLQLIEDGVIDRFPSSVQARGMLANYAKFLDLDADSILLKYAEAIQSEFVARRAAEQQPAKSSDRRSPRLPLWLRNLVSADLIFVSILGVSIVIFLFWGLSRINATQSTLVQPPTAPSIADVLLPSSTPQPTPTAAPDLLDLGVDAELTAGDEIQPALGTFQPPANSNAVAITLIVRQRTWLRVSVDGEISFDGRVAPGETLTFMGNDQVELLTGNAAALQVFFNDQDLGILGVLGQVVNIIYTNSGPILPTPTTVPSPTPTLPVTPTPTGAAPIEQP